MENQIIIYDQSQIEKEMKLAAVAARYQDILNSVASIEFTKENVGQDLLAPAREVLAALDKKKTEIKRPHLDANKKAEEMYKQLAQPLEQLISDKVKQKTAIAQALEAERKKIEEEKAKLKAITEYISKFYDGAAAYLSKNDIVSDDIVKLERRIGVELSRKNFYGSLYDSFVQKTDELRKIIHERKEFVRRNEKLREELAKVGDNEEKKAEILEEKEDLSIFMMQNKLEFQKAAVISSEDIGVMVGESDAMPVVAARTQWTYEVTDIKKLYDKHPELVTIEPNAAAIRIFLSEQKNKPQNLKADEIIFPGLRLYKEKKYK